MTDLLRVNDLHISFSSRAGRIDAVRGLSFRLRAGSCTAIVGESGSGKSVCAQAIMGILPKAARIRSGEILFNDPSVGKGPCDLTRLDPRSDDYRAIRGGRISIIFQEPMTSLSPLHTIGNQISEALELHDGSSSRQAHARCIEMLELVKFPDPERAFKTYPFELSGGLRQRAVIAMAMVCGPALLIADEPTTALDVTVQAQILSLMKNVQGELDTAILLITHDMGVVANMADEVVVVFKGELMESGMVDDIFSAPGHPYLQALMNAVPRIDGNPEQKLVPLRPINPHPGQLLRRQKEQAGKNGEPILKVRNLTKTFQIRRSSLFAAAGSRLTAVDRVNFDIRRGECLGLVGESGCGKTTIAKMIMGAIDADSGHILFDDGSHQTDLAGMKDADLIPFRQKIQYIFQDPYGSLNPRMTVFDILSEPLGIHGIGDRTYRRELVMELMDLVGLDPRYLSRYPHSFSGGQRQRIGIARALTLRPQFVICDEPVSALDVSIQAQVLNLLKDLQRDMGLTYLFITHDLAVVNYIADRIAVMCRGRLVEIAPRSLLFKNPRHPYTRALLASAPSPELGHPLDFKTICEGGMTEPENWPVPFHAEGEAEPALIRVEDGHYVRAYEAVTA